MEFFDLVFDVPTSQAFTYRADEKGLAGVGKRALAPFGRRETMGYIVAERADAPAGVAPASIKAIRRVIDAEPVFDTQTIALAQWLASFYLGTFGQALATMIPSGRRAGSAHSLAISGDEITDATLTLSDEQEHALRAILAPEALVRPAVVGAAAVGAAGEGNAAVVGAAGEGNAAVVGAAGESAAASSRSAAVVTAGEGNAVAVVGAAGEGNAAAVVAAGEGNAAAAPRSAPTMFYLYGITGSGKTEVFLRAAEIMLKAGKSVIYLVPEIALTYQTAEAIGKRFGAEATTFHSEMGQGARFTEWLRIKRGEVRIVVGPRSAVFAPVRELGLIIIDEEHDGSYKSGTTPRYHARQVAMRRCSGEGGGRLVMGSATPSVEAWKLMGEGVITRLDLTRRLSGGSVPRIKPVNLARAEGCLTNELKDEIRKTAQMGRQTILFLNRRGFAYFYHCPECGYELTCQRCSVSLTWHKEKKRALCHYCGYEEVPPLACPKCGSLTAGYAGFGTEMIEEEVRRVFPDLRIRRADADSTKTKGSLQKTLESFRAHDFDILLGTQMVAKGLNFPGVRLVGVVLADTGLHLPDFRAVERVFSLIVQVAGRSGRYFPDGKVIVQTFRPDDPAIQSACALDVEGFFAAELAQRELLGFPPYTRLIRFTIRGYDEARANAAIMRLGTIAEPLLPADADMLGPAECPISMIARSHRRQLLLRGHTMSTLHRAARTIIAQYDHGRDSRVYLEVDVDPVSLL
jgi:primosomal protein N' (replication factor Y)